jgi:hypothetical protein
MALRLAYTFIHCENGTTFWTFDLGLFVNRGTSKGEH